MNVVRHVLHSPRRLFASNSKPQVKLEAEILKNIESALYKPKNHPGIIKRRTAPLPETLINSIWAVMEDFPVRSLVKDSAALIRHLHGKRPPLESSEFKDITEKIRERVLNKTEKKESEMNTSEEKMQSSKILKDKVNHILRKEVYHWKPVNYNQYNSLVYLVARVAPEFSVLSKIFGEIAQRDTHFEPRSFFDFGSGVGTATWAAKEFWAKSIYEYFNVDSSSDMNDLAQTLLHGGKGGLPIKGVFYRQFLPATHVTYDLVVSAYSLMELPSRQSRLETVLNLWNKTHNYMVIVEQGTYSGFKVINEIRDFIIHSEKSSGHVFSPCPHDLHCPRYLSGEGTPCNFAVNYETLPIGQSVERYQERYCYVVIKKGNRAESDPQWPRVVRETLVRHKHTICRACTKNGKLQEVIFTASKHGKPMYYCARKTKWGDLLPIDLQEKNIDEGGTGEDT